MARPGLPASLPRRSVLLCALLSCVGAMAADKAADGPSAQRFPDVLRAEVRAAGADRFDFDITVSSPYDTPQRYADAMRVTSRDGTVFGVRKLWHDHAGEQPFTRDLYGVHIPPGVRSVLVQARDRQHGWGGRTAEVALPGR